MTILRTVIFLFLGLISGLYGHAQADISVHDPAIIRQGSTYYIFCTGFGISVFSSKDKLHWKREKPVFNVPPQWAVSAVPGFRGHIWAPDISYHNGQYYLYYAISSFGKNNSAIGVATNATLNSSDSNFKWVDHGEIIKSVSGRDMWNAIDPNLIEDNKGIPWLTFGSFWEGIKLVKLDTGRLRIATPQTWFSIASRARTFGLPDSLPGNAAIEAPFIIRHEDYYYLFVSFDYCCRGIRSNYKMMVGRATSVRGPYMDKNGIAMLKGGGTLLLAGDAYWPGVGHNAVLSDSGKDYLVFHGYDAAQHGISKLRILPIIWKEGWPTVKDDARAIVL